MELEDNESVLKVRAEQTRLLYQQTLFAVAGNVAVGLLFMVLLWPALNPTILMVWAAGLIVLAGLRMGLWLRLKNGKMEPDKKAMNTYCTVTTLTSLFWGGAGILPMMQSESLYQIFAVMICAGISGASLATLGSHFRCYAKFLFITMGPITIVMLFQSEPVLFGTGILASIYILTMAATGHRFSEALNRSFALAHEKQALIDELKDADESKTEYLARMSHEIRTPLNGVLGMAELLRRTGLDSRQAAYLNAVSSSGKALMGVVNEILDFSRIAAGKLKLDREELSTEELATESLAIFTASAEEKGLKLLVGIEPDVPETIIGDPIRLRQVIVNLVGNAIKFTDRGSVTLSIEVVELQGNYIILKFSVSDTGIGIPKHAQKQLFEAFTQAPVPRNRQQRGSGLGLNISRRLVQLMGGEISVTSSPGNGSTFRFTGRFALPATHNFARTPPRPLANASALLVESNSEAMLVLQSTLSAQGVKVTTCNTAGQAKKVLQQRRSTDTGTDLLITEYHLPDSDGVSLCQEASAITQGKIRMVLLSPLSTGPDRQSTRNAGIGNVVTAPITPKRLSRAIEAAMGLSETADFDVSANELYPSFNGLRVLVAEDDPINQAVITEILNRFDCESTIVNDGLEALEASNNQSFDIILMDCEMPRMDGCEAAAHIRRVSQELGVKHLPIIAMTAHTGDSIRHRMEQAGMNDCIIKPLDLDTVCTAIERWSRSEASDPVQESTPPDAKPLTDEVLDQERMNKLGEMMEGDLSRLASIYEKQSDGLLSQLSQARHAKDLTAMRRHLHALIGASSSVGAERVAHIAEEVRQDICNQNKVSADCEQKISELRIEVDRALNALLRIRSSDN